MSHTLGILDIGSNTLRLLVAQADEDLVAKPLLEKSWTTRLGRFEPSSQRLSAFAVEDSLRAVEEAVRLSKEMGAEQVLGVATAAVRNAVNGADFVQACLRLGGLSVKVLSPEEEALTVYTGFLSGEARPPGKALLLDLGGGSSEIILGQGDQVERVLSLNIGCISLLSEFPCSDALATKEWEHFLQTVRDRVSSFLEGVSSEGAEVVGLSGSIVQLAAVDRGFGDADVSRLQGHVLSSGRIREILDHLRQLSLQDRRAVSGLRPDRADSVLTGGVLLQQVMAQLGCERLRIGLFGLRRGVALRYCRGELF
ncbi:MAG: hypothetical protein JW937_10445 [Candidatus Omnitrophica bacterium]|nr:hypothetical protein [Candidatus Omnitrophota bacterium]